MHSYCLIAPSRDALLDALAAIDPALVETFQPFEFDEDGHKKMLPPEFGYRRIAPDSDTHRRLDPIQFGDDPRAMARLYLETPLTYEQLHGLKVAQLDLVVGDDWPHIDGLEATAELIPPPPEPEPEPEPAPEPERMVVRDDPPADPSPDPAPPSLAP